MQISGSVAHVKILGSLKKLEKRSKKLLFVGYAPKWLWNQEEKKIVIARDVRFEELRRG